MPHPRRQVSFQRGDLDRDTNFGVKCPQAKEHQQGAWADSLSPPGGRGKGGGTRPAEDRFFSRLPICLENEAFLTGMAGHRDLR